MAEGIGGQTSSLRSQRALREKFPVFSAWVALALGLTPVGADRHELACFQRAFCAGGSTPASGRVMPQRASAPLFGATCTAAGVSFHVWAPATRRVELLLAHDSGTQCHAMRALGNGIFGCEHPALPGELYCYLLDGRGPFPDVASRFQPFGVHGPSQIIDPTTYQWRDTAWRGVDRTGAVIYELHVGTFTSEGTFAGAATRLPYLRDLGVTLIELMPVGDFPGERNWGYDVASWFAPARCYGEPDDLRRLVDAAHEQGIGVLLDVVYNHVGPDGAYHGTFSPFYFSTLHATPWGAAMNLDGTHSGVVRELLMQNACYWMREFHFDGLRLDATHALIDTSTPHFLAELCQRVRAQSSWPVLLVAEDERNDARVIRAESDDGYGLDAVWSDDLHHQLRRHVAGDNEGYYANYSGSLEDIATTIRRGWFFVGQSLPTSGFLRGSDPTGLEPEQFVVCLQNHDQVGNRAFGDRLHHCIDTAVYRALSVLLLTLPQTPLLFMGQEWAASAPFLFFTDHRPAIGAHVSRGRRREFAAFRAFADAKQRETIPDPQAFETFARSRLDWLEQTHPAHHMVHDLYRSCLRLRAEWSSRQGGASAPHQCAVAPGDALVISRCAEARAQVTVVRLDMAASKIDLAAFWSVHELGGRSWEVALHTEDPTYTADPQIVTIDVNGNAPIIGFPRAGAVVLVS